MVVDVIEAGHANWRRDPFCHRQHLSSPRFECSTATRRSCDQASMMNEHRRRSVITCEIAHLNEMDASIFYTDRPAACFH